jgi:signal transduction histidine kinase
MRLVFTLVRLWIQGTHKMACVYLVLLMTVSVFFIPEILFSQRFIRINSGTKSDILKIDITRDGNVYFLTDKIFTLQGSSWGKVDIPAEGPITSFDAISPENIWFSNTLETSTSMLYHYHDGIIENIRTPFANDITSINFVSGQLGFFASYSDVVVYSHGSFGKVNPVATSGYIFRVDGGSSDKYRVLTQFNELFVYEKGKFSKFFPDAKVKDFQYDTPDHGFILSDDTIFELNGLNVLGKFQNPLLKTAKKIFLRNDELWIIGEAGLILVLQDSTLRRISYEGKENLNSLAFGGENEIWIAGENGLLLYSGNRHFLIYNERYPGFSAQKLISFGIDVDNQYGVALADFNGDDKTDIYAVCISDPDKLFINKIDPVNADPIPQSFREEALKRGALGVPREKNAALPSELKLGVATADVDNDGDEDIYVTYLNGKNKLLLNNGKGYFRDVSEQSQRACENMNRSNAAVFADVDLDGDADLFVTSEEGSNRMYLNNGNGYFTDITGSAGVKSTGGGMCASFSDVNGDGFPDLCVTFWYPSNKLYLNETHEGLVRFRDITAKTDLSKAEPSKSNAIVFADVNNDGFSDLFIANRHAVNKLYLNDGKGLFRDATSSFFENKVYLTNGAVFADFDLDGYQDLYITNVGDNVMYRNINGTSFEDVTGTFGAELSGYCTGCVAGDIDNDGDADLYVANYINGSSILFMNKMEKKNAITFKLSGTRSNRNAIGAKISLYKVKQGQLAGTLAGYREISGGGGYSSNSAKEAVFALNPGTDYYAIVYFPMSGRTIRLDQIKAGSVYRISEETGIAAFKTLSIKALQRFFTDPEIQLEIIKYLAVLIILLAYLYFQRKGPARIMYIKGMACLGLYILFSIVNQLYIFSSSLILFFISPAITIIGLIILHLVTERIYLKRQAEREKTELREKISRDLHDDLASTLGSISIYSSTLKGMDNASPVNFQHLSAKIANLTQSALQSITDIIWMTAPRNDSLRSLLSKLSAMMFDVLTDNLIRFDEKIELPRQEIVLHEKLRHDTFLILKEALNNAIRHASAKNVTLHAWVRDNTCFIQMTDDGKGFNPAEIPHKGPHGNGLVNMQRRASESGIELQIQSAVGSGSRIEISFKI